MNSEKQALLKTLATLTTEINNKKAIAMVGSGFSLNTVPKNSTSRSFPLWQDLIDAMFYDLNPEFKNKIEHANEEERNQLEDEYRWETINNALELAQKFESGQRSKMNKFIEQFIPDEEHNPGELHHLLLNVNWQDIYTTNYDTLLERANIELGNTYSVVKLPTDFPKAANPRIVKLHGTLGHQNYIITERDFLTYKDEHVPFDNDIINSMSRYSLVLFGFSGDDPNFKSWNVRKISIFGDDAPWTYLISLKEINEHKQKYWESYRVKVLNLSLLLSDSEKGQYGLAFKRLFEEIDQPPSFGKDSLDISQDETLKELVISWPGTVNKFFNLDTLANDTLSSDTIIELIQHWKEERLKYPGWLVLPHTNREKLWTWTVRCINPIFNTLPKLEVQMAVAVAFELTWRMKRSLIPFYLHHVAILEDLLESINPFPEKLDLPNAEYNPKTLKLDKAEWLELENQWMEIALFVIEDLRQGLDIFKFNLWYSRLTIVSSNNNEFYHGLQYEKCLFSLNTINQLQLSKDLKSWDVKDEHSKWLLRKAAIHAEILEVDEALNLLDLCLEHLPKQEKLKDVTKLSIESWVLINSLRLKEIQVNSKGYNYQVTNEEKLRQEKLKEFRCDPNDEIEFLESKVLALPIDENPSETRQENFDPDSTSLVFNFNTDLYPDRIRFPLMEINMLEQGGIPIRSGYHSYLNNVGLIAHFLSPSAPLLALSSYVRNANTSDKSIERWLGRLDVAGMNQEFCDRFYSLFVSSLEQCITEFENGFSEKITYSDFVFSSLSELFSRFTTRFNVKQLSYLLELCIRLCRAPIISKAPSLHSALDKIFERILFTLPNPEKTQFLSRIISLPIFPLGYTQSEQITVSSIPEPSRFFNNNSVDIVYIDTENKLWTKSVKQLLTLAKTLDPNMRSRSIKRLALLFEHDLLTLKQVEEFAEAIWTVQNPTTKLPDDTGLVHHAFLTLPSPNHINPSDVIKSSILRQEFPNLFSEQLSPFKPNETMISIGRNRMHQELIRLWKYSSRNLSSEFIDNVNYVVWEEKEVVQLFEKILSWWNREKSLLRRQYKNSLTDIAIFGGKEISDRIADLTYLLRFIFIPQYSKRKKSDIDLLQSFLTELCDFGFPILSVKPAQILLESSENVTSNYGEVAKDLTNGINSSEILTVSEAVEGILYWIVYGNTNKLPSPPNNLVDSLIIKILTKRQPYLKQTIQSVIFLIEHTPTILTESNREYLCQALTFYYNDTISNVSDVAFINDYRLWATQLAASMYSYYSQNDLPIPKIILDWKEWSSNDVLPEMRHIFT